ncbi:MAG: hypothetical protein EXQ87_03770 [Alphaproteobacteria bacterium]|nr:hypothetical protein [Alphaproteobacteria bacterium]
MFRPEDLAGYATRKLLLLCDIEGAERELLDLDAAPTLKDMDVIVESHENLRPGVTKLLTDRLRNTHHITLVQDDGQRQLHNPPQWFKNLAQLDQLLAVWEWRGGPTPWLVMRSLSRP